MRWHRPSSWPRWVRVTAWVVFMAVQVAGWVWLFSLLGAHGGYRFGDQ